MSFGLKREGEPEHQAMSNGNKDYELKKTSTLPVT